MSDKTNKKNIEGIYNCLTDEQKEIYAKDYVTLVKSNLLTSALFGIVFLIFSVILPIVVLTDKELTSLWIIIALVIIFLLICIFMTIKSVISLYSSHEIKVKNYLQLINKRSSTYSKNLSDRPYHALPRTEIMCVNFYVSQLLKNEKLKEICLNYVTTNKLDILYLEYMFIPFTATKKMVTDSSLNYNYSFTFPRKIYLEETPYITFLRNLKNGRMDIDNDIMLIAHIARGAGIYISYESVIKNMASIKEKNLTAATLTKIEKIYSGMSKLVSEKVDKIKQFYFLLCNQNVITEKNIFQYFAFTFILYHYQKIKLIEYAEELLNNYHLQANEEKFKDKNVALDENIIDSLYQVGESEEVIIGSIVYLICKYYNNYSINMISDYIRPIVETRIQNIREQDSLNRLIRGEYRPLSRFNIAQIDLMNSEQFEDFVTELFNSLGYLAERTKLSGDQGVDVVAKKGIQTLAIQVKHYNQSVGNHAIMEVVGGAKFYNATLCYVVTNNYFTKSAKELASANNVILWDRDKLIEKLSEI